jgi:hypothetical protein
MATCGARVCSCCRKFMGLARELGEGELAHGLCAACEAMINAEAEEFFSRAGQGGSPRNSMSHNTPGAAVFEEVCHE